MADLRDQITLDDALACNVWSRADKRLPGVTLPVGRSRMIATWHGHHVRGEVRVSGYVALHRYEYAGCWWTNNLLLMMQ